MNPILSKPTAVTFFSEKLAQPYHKHCPLCEDSILNPEQDNRTPIFIFLDMDGPMIRDICNPQFQAEMYPTRMKLSTNLLSKEDCEQAAKVIKV